MELEKHSETLLIKPTLNAQAIDITHKQKTIKAAAIYQAATILKPALFPGPQSVNNQLAHWQLELGDHFSHFLLAHLSTLEWARGCGW